VRGDINPLSQFTWFYGLMVSRSASGVVLSCCQIYLCSSGIVLKEYIAIPLSEISQSTKSNSS